MRKQRRRLVRPTRRGDTVAVGAVGAVGGGCVGADFSGSVVLRRRKRPTRLNCHHLYSESSPLPTKFLDVSGRQNITIVSRRTPIITNAQNTHPTSPLVYATMPPIRGPTHVPKFMVMFIGPTIEPLLLDGTKSEITPNARAYAALAPRL